jgi:Uma2 family endonuclease
MTALPKSKMTADEFLAWAEGQPGRYELHHGTVYAMAPERAGHAKLKMRIARALQDAVATAACPCWVMPDGMTVRVEAEVVYEPDALVYCGQEVADDAIEIANPIILVEVLSPSTRHIDAAAKFSGYFKIPSVQHYLIVDPTRQVLIHHQRGENGLILSRIMPNDAELTLDPPGLTIDIARIFAAH